MRKDTMLMRHWDACVFENVDGAFQAIIGGRRQWVEWGKCSVMVEDRYMVEVIGLVCLYV